MPGVRQVFHQLRRHARHQRGDIEIDGAFVRKGRESGIALDVVEGGWPFQFFVAMHVPFRFESMFCSGLCR